MNARPCRALSAQFALGKQCTRQAVGMRQGGALGKQATLRDGKALHTRTAYQLIFVTQVLLCACLT